MPRINVLFVCGRNQKRSPTAHKLFQSDQRLSVRSAGTSDSSRRTIQQSDLSWADIILVMEPKFDISDDYDFMSEDLIELLVLAVDDAIEAYQTEQGAAANP